MREHVAMEGAFDSDKRDKEQLILEMGRDAASYPAIKRRLFVAQGLSLSLSGETRELKLIAEAAQGRFPDIKTDKDFFASIDTLQRDLMLSAPKFQVDQLTANL